MAAPIFTWGALSSETFTHSLNATYAEVVHWKKNVFKVPHGNAGKSFVSELASLFQAFAICSALESIALKVMPILLLQKPSRNSKAKDHIACLERCLRTWRDGDLNELTIEGRTIQQRIPKPSTSMSNDHLTRTFAKLMFQGKTKAALQLLTDQWKRRSSRSQ